MPIFEYECPFCGHEFDVLFRNSGLPKLADELLKCQCPKCPCTAWRKEIPSTFKFQLGDWK